MNVANDLDAFLNFVAGGTCPKIRAIKFIREALGISLKDAKDRFERAFPPAPAFDPAVTNKAIQDAQDQARKLSEEVQVLRSALHAEDEHSGVLRAQIHRLARLLHLVGVEAETIRRVAPAADFIERRNG